MLVMVVFFIAFRWIHLSTPLIRLFLLVLILLLMPTLNFLPVWFALRDRKSGSAGMPRPISYAVFCLKKKKKSPRPATINSPHGQLTLSNFHVLYDRLLLAS